VIATNLCFEPVVGILIRRELLMRSVKFNGDLVTQSLNHVAQLEWEWVRGWTAELVRFVCEDSEHGSANSEVLAAWVGDWLPQAHAAAEALEPVFGALPAGIAFRDARDNVQIDVDELFEESGTADLAKQAS
jgi:methane monooxygenase component A beta chain/propane monooxygenase small subunit